MPITSAARRASRASSSVQHPRAPDRYDRGLADSARCTPVTSCPASTARAAATAESTPPDMAASTRTVRHPFQLLLVSSAYWPPPAPMTVTASLRRGEADTAHPMAGRTLDRLPAIGPRRAGRWIGSVTLRLRVHAVGLRRGWAQRAAAHPATVTRQIRYASGFVG